MELRFGGAERDLLAFVERAGFIKNCQSAFPLWKYIHCCFGGVREITHSNRKELVSATNWTYLGYLGTWRHRLAIAIGRTMTPFRLGSTRGPKFR